MMKLKRIKWAFDSCNINPDIIVHQFIVWKSLPKSHGVYSIWQDDICIYVGQAGGIDGFRGRFRHHYNKAHSIEQSGTSHGKGWVANRINKNWTPNTWTVEYFLTASAVHRTFIEGAMMLEFDPLCNDENYEDRLSSNNRKEQK